MLESCCSSTGECDDFCAGFVVLFLFLLIAAESTARPLYTLPSQTANGLKRPLQNSRPYNTAHRGSNGEIPEETAAAYERAIEEGTDFIETDILSSKDGFLICFHDVTLDVTTDIARHKDFADHKRTYEVQGVNATGFFTGMRLWFTAMRTLNLTDLIARAHTHNLQVHPYTYRNENKFLHFNFHQDPYEKYDFWIRKIGVNSLFTDFTGSLHNDQEWSSPLSPKDSNNNATELLHKIASLVSSYRKV